MAPAAVSARRLTKTYRLFESPWQRLWEAVSGRPRHRAHSALEDVSFVGSGCAISKASASMLTVNVKGKTVDEARVLFDEFHRLVTGDLDPATENHLGRLTIFAGVKEYPARVKCASLAWHTLRGALEGAERVSTE